MKILVPVLLVPARLVPVLLVPALLPQFCYSQFKLKGLKNINFRELSLPSQFKHLKTIISQNFLDGCIENVGKFVFSERNRSKC
jgi:hypothetical protein